MSCSLRPALGSFTFVLAGALALGGCKKAEASGSPASTESTPSSVTTVTSGTPAPAQADKKLGPESVIGNWQEVGDASHTLEITATTLRHRHRNIPGDKAAALDYSVAKMEKGVVVMSTFIDAKGKKIALDPQVFARTGEDTLEGGNAKSKKFTKYMRIP